MSTTAWSWAHLLIGLRVLLAGLDLPSGATRAHVVAVTFVVLDAVVQATTIEASAWRALVALVLASSSSRCVMPVPPHGRPHTCLVGRALPWQTLGAESHRKLVAEKASAGRVVRVL